VLERIQIGRLERRTARIPLPRVDPDVARERREDRRIGAPRETHATSTLDHAVQAEDVLESALDRAATRSGRVDQRSVDVEQHQTSLHPAILVSPVLGVREP